MSAMTMSDAALPRAKRSAGDAPARGHALKRVYVEAEEEKDVRYPFARLAPQDRPEGLQYPIPGKHDHLVMARTEAERDVAYWHPQLCYADDRCYQGDNEMVGGS